MDVLLGTFTGVLPWAGEGIFQGTGSKDWAVAADVIFSSSAHVIFSSAHVIFTQSAYVIAAGYRIFRALQACKSS